MPDRDPEKRKAYAREYSKEWRKKNNEYGKRWREAHPEYHGKWQTAHQEERTEYFRQYRLGRGYDCRAAWVEWEERPENTERIRRTRALRGVERRARQRERVFAVLGHVCARCGFADKRALQFDHVNGGGTREFSLHRSLRAYLQSIIERIGEFQVLCANCNSIKRVENAEVGLKAISRDEWRQARELAGGRN